MSANLKFFKSSDFRRRFLRQYEEIFCFPPMQTNIFSQSNWQAVLLPSSFIRDEKTYAAIRDAAIACGDSEYVLTAMYGEPSFSVSIQAEWPNNLKIFMDSRRRAELDFAPCAELFGSQTTNWGCAFFFDEFFAVSGVPAFMTQFLESIGGANAVRTQFINYAATEWPVEILTREEVLKNVGWGY